MVFFALPLFLFPLNLFPGEIVHIVGSKEVIEPRDLSLSYFIGIGYKEEDMSMIKDFYLLPKGKILALIFIVGLPALLAYRVSLRKQKSN